MRASRDHHNQQHRTSIVTIKQEPIQVEKCIMNSGVWIQKERDDSLLFEIIISENHKTKG